MISDIFQEMLSKFGFSSMDLHELGKYKPDLSEQFIFQDVKNSKAFQKWFETNWKFFRNHSLQCS